VSFRQALVDEFEGKLGAGKDARVPKVASTNAPSSTMRHRIKQNKGEQMGALKEEESMARVHRRVHDALAEELAHRTMQLKRQNLAIQDLIHKDSKVSMRRLVHPLFSYWMKPSWH
jgi:hypothetical protein